MARCASWFGRARRALSCRRNLIGKMRMWAWAENNCKINRRIAWDRDNNMGGKVVKEYRIFAGEDRLRIP